MPLVPPRASTLLLTLVAPLLLAASCEMSTVPMTTFEEGRAVPDDGWVGEIRESDSDDRVIFRLHDVTATQTGPASFEFSGDAMFGLDPDPKHFSGTGTVDMPFAPETEAIAPQMGPPVPRETYTIEAVIENEAGEVLWRLEGETDYGVDEYVGLAVDADHSSHPFTFDRTSTPFHIMGLRFEPAEVRAGEPVTLEWSGWAPEGFAITCSASVPADDWYVADDCTGGIRSLTFPTPTFDPPLTEASTFGLAFRIETGDRTWDMYEFDLRIHPAASPTASR